MLKVFLILFIHIFMLLIKAILDLFLTYFHLPLFISNIIYFIIMMYIISRFMKEKFSFNFKGIKLKYIIIGIVYPLFYHIGISMYPGEWVFISPDLIQLLTCYLEFTLIAPIIEELIYRKYLLKILNQKFNIYLSVIISSFLFYLMHLPSTQTVAINFGYHLITKTLFGMLLSVIYLKSHSIKNSMIVHMLWNASVTTFSLNPEEVSVFFYDIPLYVNEQHLIIGITLIESILLIIFMFIVIKIESSHKRHISTVY